MMNIRLTNILKRNGGLETLSKMTLNQLSTIKGMTGSALKQIVVMSNNVSLMREYIGVDIDIQGSARFNNILNRNNIKELTLQELKNINGMTSRVLTYIVATSNNAELMKEYLIAR